MKFLVKPESTVKTATCGIQSGKTGCGIQTGKCGIQTGRI